MPHHGELLDPAAKAQEEHRSPGAFARRRITLDLALQEWLTTQNSILERLVALEDYRQRQHQQLGIPRKPLLWSGSGTFDSTGVWAKHTDLSRAIFVVNFSSAQVTVASGGRQAAIPGQGPGVWFVAAGSSQTINSAGDVTDWALYGTPGGLVNVTIFGRFQPPFVGATNSAVIGGTP